jgi:hypothetical protein
MVEKLAGKGTPEQQAAVAGFLDEHGVATNLGTLLELSSKVEVPELKTHLVDAVKKQATPKLASGRPGTPEELSAIMAGEQRAPNADYKATVAGDLAKLEMNNGSQGHTSLYRLKDGHWTKVADLGGWIR